MRSGIKSCSAKHYNAKATILRETLLRPLFVRTGAAASFFPTKFTAACATKTWSIRLRCKRFATVSKHTSRDTKLAAPPAMTGKRNKAVSILGSIGLKNGSWKHSTPAYCKYWSHRIWRLFLIVPSKHYFGLKKSNGQTFDLRVTHRTEENLAIASVCIGDWTHELEADLGDLATQSVPLMLKPL